MVQYNPSYTVSHVRHVKIQQITQCIPSKFHITQYLRHMDRHYTVHRFQFHYHTFFHQQIQPVSCFYELSAVTDRQLYLSFQIHAHGTQFMCHTSFIRTFEQSCSQLRMNPHGRIQYGPPCALFSGHNRIPFASLASFAVGQSALSASIFTSRTRSWRRTLICCAGFWYLLSGRLRMVRAMAATMATSRITAAISNGYT